MFIKIYFSIALFIFFFIGCSNSNNIIKDSKKKSLNYNHFLKNSNSISNLNNLNKILTEYSCAKWEDKFYKTFNKALLLGIQKRISFISTKVYALFLRKYEKNNISVKDKIYVYNISTSLKDIILKNLKITDYTDFMIKNQKYFCLKLSFGKSFSIDNTTRSYYSYEYLNKNSPHICISNKFYPKWLFNPFFKDNIGGIGYVYLDNYKLNGKKYLNIAKATGISQLNSFYEQIANFIFKYEYISLKKDNYEFLKKNNFLKIITYSKSILYKNKDFEIKDYCIDEKNKLLYVWVVKK